MKINLKQLTIDDLDRFSSYFSRYTQLISEYTFTNLFVWNDSRQISYALMDEGVIICADSYGELFYMPPVGFNNNRLIVSSLLENGQNNGILPSIRRADERFISDLNGFHLIEMPDHYDYVYHLSDLSHLPGRNFKNKRGFVRKFMSNYDYEFVPYESRYRNDCIELIERWIESKNSADIENYSGLSEYNAMKKMFEYHDILPVQTGLILIDGKVAAFSSGERLNNNTFVVHFEKADTKFVGIYQAINQLFAKTITSENTEFINREQDLGLEGLRKAKRSYNPVRMIKKYQISL